LSAGIVDATIWVRHRLALPNRVPTRKMTDLIS
jgi:hypothetical protein